MKLKFAAVLLFFVASGHAADGVTTAGSMARNCAELTKGEAGDQEKQLFCAASMSGFLAGWNAGIGRGLRTAFVLDSKNLATTNGIDDLQTRIQGIRPAAQCVGASGITFPRFLERYVAYVTARPELTSAGFDEAAIQMIENTICGRRRIE